MVVVKEHSFEWPPIGAPLNMQRDEHPGSPPAFNSSVNAVSFGFVATAILISMFLVMAIFERFLRPTSSDLTPSARRRSGDLEAQLGFNGKLSHPSPKVSHQKPNSFAFLLHSRKFSGSCFELHFGMTCLSFFSPVRLCLILGKVVIFNIFSYKKQTWKWWWILGKYL